MSWKSRIRRHFAGRELLSIEQLAQEFGCPGSARSELEEALRLFNELYYVPIGVLRATDSLTLFTTPPSTRNPIAWLFDRAGYEDSVGELEYRLARRTDVYGRSMTRQPTTLGEYVTAWCCYNQ